MSKNSRFVAYFSNLHIDKSKGQAPHKPLLLLSIIELIWKGAIVSPRIELTPQLIAAFDRNWDMLVTTQHTKNIVLPYYHMKFEKFWDIFPNPGHQGTLYLVRSVRRMSEATRLISHAEIDSELFDQIMNTETGHELASALLNAYFPETGPRFWSKDFSAPASHEERLTMVAEAEAEYGSQFISDAELTDFRRNVLYAYNHTCAISGLRIVADRQVSMVEACPIVPFFQSGDSSVANGIALCPNLYGAFDAGLISIDPRTHEVLVSDRFREHSSLSAYSIAALAGKRVFLPSDASLHPGSVNLEWHLENVFMS